MNKQVVSRRRAGAEDELRHVVAAMLEDGNDTHLTLARSEDFTEVLSVIADRNEPVLVVASSVAAATAWAEELSRRGVAARALDARDSPPQKPRVVMAGPNWLMSPDHCLWTERMMRRVLIRGGAKPFRALAGVQIIGAEVAGETEVEVPARARRVGYGFARVRFAVQPVGGVGMREHILREWRGAGLNVYERGDPAAGAHLYCAHPPRSFAELARWIAAAGAQALTVLFGPDDLLVLQVSLLQQVAPIWPPPTREVVNLLAWLEGASCRTVIYAAAFGETVAACGQCEACRRESPAVNVPIVARTSEEDSRAAEPMFEPLTGAEAVVFERLREWRARRARQDALPPYVVFANATLMALARARPQDREAFLAVKGCGERKWESFGAEVARVIADASNGVDDGARDNVLGA